MQNYEEFISEISGTESAVKNAALASVKQEKAIAKNLETGNLTETRKSLASLREAIAQLTEQTEALQAGVDAFDTQDYFVSGDFTRQLLES